MNRKFKLLKILKQKELIKQTKAAQQVKKMAEELNKCEEISRQLGELASTQGMASGILSISQLHSDRVLALKLIEQKTIMDNRKDFLTGEVKAASKGISGSLKKLNCFEDASTRELKNITNKKDNILEEIIFNKKKG